MKKKLLLASAMTLVMLMSSSIAMAENTVKVDNGQKAFTAKERPKFYDENGNELKAPPKPGTKIYDKNGKEIKAPQRPGKACFRGKERPKFYDKDGKELKAPPKPGTKVYDKNGKEIDFKKMKHHPKGPELNLTDEQKAQADKFREESKSKMKPIFKEMKELNQKINAIYEDEKTTKEQKEKQLKPLMEKITKLHLQANEIRKADMKKFESILTDEQKTKLEEFKKEHKNRPHGHKGNMGGKMMPPPPAESK